MTGSTISDGWNKLVKGSYNSGSRSYLKDERQEKSNIENKFTVTM